MDLGWVLFIIGGGLLILEALIPGFFVAIPGTILVVIGLILVFVPDLLMSPTGIILLVLVTIAVSALTIYFYKRLAPGQKPQTTSDESLAGKKGEVIKEVLPGTIDGKVKIGEQVWSATSDAIIPAGVKVVVKRAQGVHVFVIREEQECKS